MFINSFWQHSIGHKYKIPCKWECKTNTYKDKSKLKISLSNMLTGWPTLQGQIYKCTRHFIMSYYSNYGTSTLYVTVTHLTFPPQYWHCGPCHPSWHRQVPLRQMPLPHSTSLHRSSEHCATDTIPKTSTSSRAKLVTAIVIIVGIILFRRYLDLKRKRNMSNKTFFMTCGTCCRLTEIPNVLRRWDRVFFFFYLIVIIIVKSYQILVSNN